MPTFLVTVKRVAVDSYKVIGAADEESARDLYGLGEEIHSDIESTEVIAVEELEEDDTEVKAATECEACDGVGKIYLEDGHGLQAPGVPCPNCSGGG